jgi:hypothetical protein
MRPKALEHLVLQGHVSGPDQQTGELDDFLGRDFPSFLARCLKVEDKEKLEGLPRLSHPALLWKPRLVKNEINRVQLGYDLFLIKTETSIRNYHAKIRWLPAWLIFLLR